jgi:hypothetical protein
MLGDLRNAVEDDLDRRHALLAAVMLYKLLTCFTSWRHALLAADML